MWAWASANVTEDYKEQGKLLFSLLNTLTWWLQPEIKSKMSKQNTQQWPEAANYIEELRANGASEEYINKEVKRMSEEQDNNDFDDMELIKGPK